MHHLSNLLFFGIPLLYYYINLNSSIICCLSCGDIYLSFGVLVLASFDVLVILSAVLLFEFLFFKLLFLKHFLLHLLQIF